MTKLLLLVGFHLVLLLVTQFIPWPENLLWPYLNLSGLKYYQDIFVIYPPLFWELLTNFYRIFGISVGSLQAFSYLVVIVTDALLWKASDKRLLPLVLFIPMQIFFEGNGIWVDQLLAPIFLAAFISFQKKSWLLLGFFLGLSLVVKQTAIYFVGVLILGAFRPKVFLGLLVPLSFGLVYLILNNSLWNFYRSAVLYILTFHSTYDLQRQWPNWSQIFIVALLFIPAILTGVIRRKYLLTVLLLASTLGVFTRFEYFHLQPALPFLAMLLSLSPLGLISWFVFLIFFGKFFVNSFLQAPRFTLSRLPNFVTGRTMFINTWDHYYFSTKSLPAGNFFVPSTPWTMDFPSNQEMLLKNLGNNPPKYVFMNQCFKVKEVCYRPRKIAEYVEKNYLQMGELPDGTGVFKYDPMSLRKKL